jgi:hypothetical protein
VAERRPGTDEDGTSAGDIQCGGFRVDSGATASIGRLRGFQPPCQ